MRIGKVYASLVGRGRAPIASTMRKWPKGIARQLAGGVRTRLLSELARSGFSEFPIGGHGRFSGGIYSTDLFRLRGSDLDIVSLWVLADGQHPLEVYVDAVRCNTFEGPLEALPFVSRFPIEVQHRMMPRTTLMNFWRPVFRLGPPWPSDRDAAVARLIDQISSRLPNLLQFLETGEERWLLRKRLIPRVPASSAKGPI